MKKLIALLVVFFFAGTCFAQIATTAHDFSGETWSGGKTCIACHTPHHAKVAGAPLWNRESTSSTFTPYSNTTIDATIGQPTGSARLCLSCHDGSIALDSFGDNTGSTFLADGDAGFLDDDLSNDHPISFAYSTAIAGADGELYDPSTQTTSLGGTIDNDLLFGGQMQCASCHDVHNSEGHDFLLRIDNAGSALCITCHEK